jgi:hypothetical protein
VTRYDRMLELALPKLGRMPDSQVADELAELGYQVCPVAVRRWRVEREIPAYGRQTGWRHSRWLADDIARYRRAWLDWRAGTELQVLRERLQLSKDGLRFVFRRLESEGHVP